MPRKIGIFGAPTKGINLIIPLRSFHLILVVKKKIIQGVPEKKGKLIAPEKKGKRRYQWGQSIFSIFPVSAIGRAKLPKWRYLPSAKKFQKWTNYSHGSTPNFTNYGFTKKSGKLLFKQKRWNFSIRLVRPSFWILSRPGNKMQICLFSGCPVFHRETISTHTQSAGKSTSVTPTIWHPTKLWSLLPHPLFSLYFPLSFLSFAHSNSISDEVCCREETFVP